MLTRKLISDKYKKLILQEKYKTFISLEQYPFYLLSWSWFSQISEKWVKLKKNSNRTKNFLSDNMSSQITLLLKWKEVFFTISFINWLNKAEKEVFNEAKSIW